MSAQGNVQLVKDFLAAIGRGDTPSLRALAADDIEWIIPGESWPLAGTYRGHAGLAKFLRKASEEMEISSPEPSEFVAQGDRVVMIGFAAGKVKATKKAFEDHFVFVITVLDGKVKTIREYVDTQALARASQPPESS